MRSHFSHLFLLFKRLFPTDLAFWKIFSWPGIASNGSSLTFTIFGVELSEMQSFGSVFTRIGGVSIGKENI